MLIYKIRLPKGKDAEAFVTFMRERYFPAVHKGATRIGQVTDLALLEGEATDEYLWHVGWSGLSSGGPRIDNEEVQREFKAFGARLKLVGSYAEVAAWHKKRVR